MDATVLLATLGQRTRELRQELGLTLRALAARSKVSLRFLLEVEAGRGNISVRRLGELAEALGTTPADLITARTPSPDVRPIALLGLRGAGKTTLGKRLARRLHLPFVELDQRIEARAGLAIGEIFSLHGEEFYRRLEHDALADLLAAPTPMVLAVGGGLVASSDSYALLRRHAVTVWLKAHPEEYWDRVIKQGDRRPIDDHPQARQALRDLVARREPLYGKADLTVDTSAVTVPKAVDRLSRALARAMA